MSAEFEIQLEAKDLFQFNMHQTYTGFSGWLSVCISVVLFVGAYVAYGEKEAGYIVSYVLFGILFLVYQPITLFLRSKSSIAKSEVLRNPLHFVVTEEGFCVTQGEQNALLPWDQIYKISSTKKYVYVYSNRINAYIIPRAQVGERYGALAELAKAKLPKYRIRMK